MTVRTLVAPAPAITIVEGMILKLEAVSPTTGAAITGVKCSRWAVYGTDAGGVGGDLDLGDPTVTWVWGDDGKAAAV